MSGQNSFEISDSYEQSSRGQLSRICFCVRLIEKYRCFRDAFVGNGLDQNVGVLLYGSKGDNRSLSLREFLYVGMPLTCRTERAIR